MNKVAIYHFTDDSGKRPIINEKQMVILRRFASGYGTIMKEYLDKSLKKCEQKQKQELMEEIADYDVLVTKDFYHIAVNTGACISLMQKFLTMGIKTYSIEDGKFTFSDTPFDRELNIAIYHAKYEDNTPSAQMQKKGNSITAHTQVDVLRLFAKKKTNWKVVDAYIDEAKGQSDDKQKNLLKLIENRKKYDLVLCKDFNTIHWRTAKFCKRRNELKLDIYSMKEGYLKYERRDSYEEE